MQQECWAEIWGEWRRSSSCWWLIKTSSMAYAVYSLDQELSACDRLPQRYWFIRSTTLGAQETRTMCCEPMHGIMLMPWWYSIGRAAGERPLIQGCLRRRCEQGWRRAAGGIVPRSSLSTQSWRCGSSPHHLMLRGALNGRGGLVHSVGGLPTKAFGKRVRQSQRDRKRRWSGSCVKLDGRGRLPCIAVSGSGLASRGVVTRRFLSSFRFFGVGFL